MTDDPKKLAQQYGQQMNQAGVTRDPKTVQNDVGVQPPTPNDAVPSTQEYQYQKAVEENKAQELAQQYGSATPEQSVQPEKQIDQEPGA